MAAGSRIDRCDMRDAIDHAGAQQLRSDPARKAARATVSPERVFDRMTDIRGFEPSDALMAVRGRCETVGGNYIFICCSGREGAGLRERGRRGGARLRFEEAVGVPAHPLGAGAAADAEAGTGHRRRRQRFDLRKARHRERLRNWREARICAAPPGASPAYRAAYPTRGRLCFDRPAGASHPMSRQGRES